MTGLFTAWWWRQLWRRISAIFQADRVFLFEISETRQNYSSDVDKNSEIATLATV